jgi:2-dehydro-3-deoxy-D-gluconate 5-dehydrogenase
MPRTNLFDLSGRVAAVTGDNGGIGRGIAIGLAQAGAEIAVLARNEEKNQRVMSELQALGVAALAVKWMSLRVRSCTPPSKRLKRR